MGKVVRWRRSWSADRTAGARRGRRRHSPAGVPFLSFALAALTLMFAPRHSHGVVTFDLFHDSPESRQMLKDEIERTSVFPVADEGADDKPVEYGELESIWFAREKFLQIGEKEKARKQLELIWEKEMEKGVRNLPEYGEVLVREARRNLARGQVAEAEEVLSYARKIYPDGLGVSSAAASLAMKKSVLNVAGAGQELLSGVKAVQRSFRLQSWLAVNALGVLFGALCLFFAVSVLIMLLRNGKLIAHDISELMPRRFLPRTRTILGLVVLCAPLLAGMPVWWWFLFGGVLALPYVNRFSRAILVLAAVFLFSLPWQAKLVSSLLSMHRQPLVDRVVTVREGHWSENEYLALRALSAEEGADMLASFSLGLVAKRKGSFEEARKAYERARDAAPGSAAIANNLGNLAYIEKDWDGAIEHYQEAIGFDSKLFAPHYNLSLAYREKIQFAEGEAESVLASTIDPDQYAYYIGISGTHFNRYTVDVVPQLKDIWKLALSGNKWQKATADHLWLSFMLVPSMDMWSFLVAGVFILGLGWWALRTQKGLAETCHKCGRVFCARCRSGRNITLCSQCHHIFVRKEGVEAKVRVKKMADIKKSQQLAVFTRIALAVVFPGGGHMAMGRFVVGTLFLLPSSFFVAILLVNGKPMPAAWHLDVAGGWQMAGPFIAGTVFLWALSFWQALRLED